MAPDTESILLSVAGAALLSLVSTLAAIAYARRRAMFDQPGRRRSHTVATPRGGGVGIVLAVVVATLWLVADQFLPSNTAAAFALGLLLVAAVGWIDDHRPLPAGLRLTVHFIAAALLVSQLPVVLPDADPWMNWLRFGMQVLLLATAINFWNFMDGINGLVTTQSAWVATCAMLALGAVGLWAWALLAAALAGACLGFLPLNFPRARIFLGDVGSGGLGFACGGLLLLAVSTGSISAWSALLIASALLLDAGFTLLSRMLRRRRWYHPHREHLYQWLVRSGHSHTRTTWLYLSWNLILVLPLLWLSHVKPGMAPMLALAAVLAGAAVWVQGKHAAHERVKSGAVR